MSKLLSLVVLWVLWAEKTRGVPRSGSGVINASHQSEGRIIFPSDDEDDYRQSFLAPPCRNSDFCEDAPSYPHRKVQAALRNQNYRFFTTIEVVPEIANRGSHQDEGTPLCRAKQVEVMPRVAKDVEDEWLYVVNVGNSTQSVIVEKCAGENAECDYIGGALPYITTCKQMYIHRKLMTLSRNGRTLQARTFKFPSSCSCFIKIGDDSRKDPCSICRK